MKRRIVEEIFVYCFLPIIAIGFYRGQSDSIPWFVLIIGLLYAFCIKKKENRVNYTFLSFLILYSTYFILTGNIKGDMLVQFNLGFVIFISIAIFK